MMKALIVDLLAEGDCEVTRKQNVECYQVKLEGGEEATITPAELLKQLRFRKSQDAKSKAASPTAAEQQPPTEPGRKS